MRLVIVATVCLIACVGPADAANPREACKARVQTQIDRIDKRMRRGYTAAEGNALRKQRRDLKDRYEACKRL